MTTNDYYEKYLRKPGDNICPVCHKEITKRLGLLGFPKHCSTRCSTLDKETQKKKKETYFQKTGYDSYSNPEFIEKQKKTCLERFGVENAMCLPEMIEQRTKTMIEKYGYGFYAQTDEMHEKTKETFLRKYGVENSLQLETVREKAKNTKKERYGDENFNNRGLAENTNLERYGVEWFPKTADWKTKTQETCMQKYGVKYHCILNKPKKYVYDNRFFDSSWEIAYYIWLKDHNIQFEFHPDIAFKYVTTDGKEHKYFPDFKIGDEFIEIKGNHLLENTWSPPEKISCIKEHGKILGAEEIKPYLNYILNKYGKNYLKQFKRQK